MTQRGEDNTIAAAGEVCPMEDRKVITKNAAGLKEWHDRATAQVHIPKTEADLTTYKFRCEWPHDAWAVHQAALEFIYTMHLDADHVGPGGTEPVVTVQVSGISMDELRTIMESIVDGHVMVETLETPENYTGERNYAGRITSIA